MVHSKRVQPLRVKSSGTCGASKLNHLKFLVIQIVRAICLFVTLLCGIFIWSRDLDGDGEAEWVTSPVDGYWPQYQTQLSHWDESSESLKRLKKIPGVP